MADRTTTRMPVQAGFSLPELMFAMLVTLALMVIVFTMMRQNQSIFTTETGVTSMNENVRAAVDLLTREVQAAGTGLRGMTAPILGVDGEGDVGDRLVLLIGDPNAPIAEVRSNSPYPSGDTQIALIPPAGTTGPANAPQYLDDRKKVRSLYQPGDRYVLYNGARFVVVRVSSASVTTGGDILVSFTVDKSNPRPKFGDYRFRTSADSNGALFAKLDGIVTYRYNKETETLERKETEDGFVAVAHGIIGFQTRYRVLKADQTLGDPLDDPPTERDTVRSLVVTLRARTIDSEPDSDNYRETSERIEITPRNVRLRRPAGEDAGPS